MCTILKNALETDKPFYKLNYVNDYYNLVIPPSEEEVHRIDDFIGNLSAGDKIDVLKTSMHSKRVCWLPGVVKKISSLSVYVNILHEKGTFNFDRKLMQVHPDGEKK
jgi:hypothetical protein